MKKHPKVIVVMPAHNAAKTLKKAYQRLPHKYINRVILVDDASSDNTYAIAKKLNIQVFKNSINLGYGGNLKVCFKKALAAGADIIIEYHPDNQYDPINLPLYIEKAKSGFDLAIGSRFIHPKEALDHKMPLIKFIANRSLSFIDQFVLGIELTEFHSGFRMYTRKLLENIPYKQNSDDYLFSFEIIVQAVYYKFRVAEVQVQCDYHSKMHTANMRRSSVYALGTFLTLYQYIKAKFMHSPNGPFLKVKTAICPLCTSNIVRKQYKVTDAVSHKNFSINFCTPCKIGCAYPQPENLSKFYTSTYYSRIKTVIYKILQIRRPKIIQSLKNNGNIIDIGCGDGSIGDQLDADKYNYLGIETPFAKIKNLKIKTVGIEGIKEKNNSFDFVTFWESFEHLKYPLKALKKSYRLLKNKGYLIIECPNFNSWEKYLFGDRWFHLDPPRHMFHYTPSGLIDLIKKQGFRIIDNKSIYAPEYIPLGFAQSILYLISPNLNLFAKYKSWFKTAILSIVLLTLSVILFPITYIFYLFNGSPIQMIVAQKKEL